MRYLHASWGQGNASRRPAIAMLLVTALLVMAAHAGLAMAQAPPGSPEAIRIGIVTFLSGPPAGPFGIPGRNAAEILIEQLNSGQAPEPYGQRGIGGVPIVAVYQDESADPVTNYRRLVSEERVDAVIGYISSANCLALAPIAEELKALTIFFDCGTPRIFEEGSHTYVFRTAAHAALDSIAAARYLMAVKPDLRSIAGINQNYAWGQDSWVLFRDAVKALRPDVEVLSEQFPQLYAGNYLAEISALLRVRADVVHSSLWGGDLEALVIQALPRGLFQTSTVLFSAGETMMPRLAGQLPEGVLVGARGWHGLIGPDNPLSQWFDRVYEERYGLPPVYPSYHMAQAILGLKHAYEKAIAASGRWPTTEEVVEAFRYAEFPTPSGTISMAIGGGHQAVESAAYGVTRRDPQTGRMVISDVMVFGPQCVLPPDGMTTEEWIAQGFPGAVCP